MDPAEAAARGATLVLPREVPSHVLASALLSAAAWWREEAALREERELLLDRLVASERTASLGTLSAGIAHEINNPLASVVANLAILAEQLPEAAKKPALMSELKDAVAEAQRGADRVAQIVRGLKVFSRGDDERRRSVDLAQVADSALRLVANELRHRARVVRDFKPAPPVEASEPHLVQVFVNLVLNAAQSIPAGDAKQNEVRVAIRPGGSGQVIAEVADTGAGMSADVLARVFDPFFTTRRVGDGVGLGLSICHGIVTSLGGRIAAKSEPGKGSLFRMTPPAARASVAADREPSLAGGGIDTAATRPHPAGGRRSPRRSRGAAHPRGGARGDERDGRPLRASRASRRALRRDPLRPDDAGDERHGAARGAVADAP